jgi:hypothetical protein
MRGRRAEILLLILVIMLMLFSSSIAHAESVSTSATVINTAPTTDNLDLSPDDDPAIPGVQVITLVPNRNKVVTIVANVSDKNGWDDIVNVTAEIAGPDVVEDSPVNLSLDTSVNIATAIYKGSFNMSNHLEGDYKVEVTVTDAWGLNGTNSRNFTYAICKLPDLVITDIWIVKAGKKNRIYYNITNIGTQRALPSYCNLTINGVFEERDLVSALQPGQGSTERFDLYEWMCTPLNNTLITVCADYENSITECIENNNCRTEIWSCTSSTQQVQSSSNGNIILDAFKAILSFFR